MGSGVCPGCVEKKTRLLAAEKSVSELVRRHNDAVAAQHGMLQEVTNLKKELPSILAENRREVLREVRDWLRDLPDHIYMYSDLLHEFEELGRFFVREEE